MAIRSSAGLLLLCGTVFVTSACSTGSDERADTSPYSGVGYHQPYWGWYGEDYYPGTGTYVYDRDRRPHRWDEGQRAFWENRQRAWREGLRDNWTAFERPSSKRKTR